MALNDKLKNENDDSERHNCEEMVALNAKLTNGSKCQMVNKNDDSERQVVNDGSKC